MGANRRQTPPARPRRTSAGECARERAGGRVATLAVGGRVEGVCVWGGVVGLASSQSSAGGKTSRQINKQYGGARITFIYTSLFSVFMS